MIESTPADDTHEDEHEPQMKLALLSAAEELIVTKGYRQTTTRAVGKLAGVNHTLIYHYFGSLDELLVELTVRSNEEFMRWERATLDVTPFSLRDYWRVHVRDFTPGNRWVKVWFELSSTLFTLRPDLRPRLLDLREDAQKILAAAIKRAVKDGQLVLPAGVTPRGVAEICWVLQNGVGIKHLIGEERGDRDLMSLIDNLILGPMEGEVAPKATPRKRPIKRLAAKVTPAKG